MDNSKVKRSITKIYKNPKRIQVTTTFVLTTKEYYKIKEQYEKINNFILDLIHDYKREESESIMFFGLDLYEYPFGYEIKLISFISIELYNKRLAIVNKHKQVVRLSEKILSK